MTPFSTGSASADHRIDARPTPPPADPAPVADLPPLALLLPDLGGGGGERVTLSLGQALAARGLEVDLVVGAARGPLLAEVPDEVELVDLGCDRLRSAVAPLRRYLQLRRPGWIAPTVDHANLLGALAARGTGTRVVLRPSTTLSHTVGAARGLGRLQIAASRRAYRRADAVVACSVGMADDLALYAGRPREAVDVVPNATIHADLRRLAAAPLDDPWFVPGAPPVVVGIGRLGPPKDLPLLLEAFARVRATRPLRLLLLGEGPQRGTIEARARELAVADDVRLPGYVANPYAYLARAGLYVLASTREGLPGSLIEAMACGAPVVATDCPSGPREILAEGRHGRLTPVGDVAALAAAMSASLEDPRPAGPAAVAAYEAPVVAEAYLQILRRVHRANLAA